MEKKLFTLKNYKYQGTNNNNVSMQDDVNEEV